MKLLSSDRLSPILVKELRQGIRSKLFIGAFLIIQLLLFLYGNALLMTNSFRGDPNAELVLFWSAIVIPMLILVPAMASQGIEKEISGKTLDLLLLTRISSYRLVLGKWASVIVQSTLLVTSTLPYLMLRYFLGGIDIWNELQALAILVLASALVAGITMGFWATKVSKLVKWVGVLAFVWLGPYMFFGLIVSRRGFTLTGSGIEIVIWLYAFITMLMMLALAASRIGPPAENHSTQIRILALVAAGAGLIVSGTLDVEALSATFAVVILVPSIIGALTEKVRTVPRWYAPFVKRKGPARWISFPLSPGWPGGTAFACLVLLLAPWFSVWLGEVRPSVFVSVAGTFLFPIALVRTFLRPKHILRVYLLAIVLLTIPIYVWGAALAFENTAIVYAIECVVGLFPPVALALELRLPTGYMGTAATLEGLLVLIWSLFALVRAARAEWRTMESLATAEPVSIATVATAAEGSLS